MTGTTPLRFEQFLNLGEPERPPLLPEAVIARLGEHWGRMQDEVPIFRPGDWVTVRTDVNLRGHGEPMLVVEVLQVAAQHDRGNRANIRVLAITDGEAMPFWAEAWQLQKWEDTK